MTKLKAFSIHLAISFAIFLIILYFIVFHWYPQPFFTTDGGWQGIRIVAGVDMVLGPLLTLVVFKAGKPRLKLDMSIIALIQISALISGTWIVFKERPMAVVFAEDKFRTVPYYQIVEEAGVKEEEIKKFGKETPFKVFVNVPEEHEALQALRRKAFREFRPLYLQGELYQPLSKAQLERLRGKSVDMAEYLKDKAEDTKRYQDFLKHHPAEGKSFLFMPLHSRYANFIIAMDADSLEFVEALDIIPPTVIGDTIRIKAPKPRDKDNGQAPPEERGEKKSG